MNPSSGAKRFLTLVLLTIVLALSSTSGSVASDLDQVLASASDRIQVAQASQQKIDQVVGQTNDLETEYKQIMKQIDGLAVYNDYIQRQITSQEQELAQLQISLDQVGIVERQIMPLMIRMLDGLEQFIDLDKPFLMDERHNRVGGLRAMMERADVTLAEKFRRLTEAFQIENDFGRTIEVYKDALVLNEAILEVNILRLGRVGLYYQTNDASATGRWDDETRQWVPSTDSGARNQVRRGIRIARKLVAPDLLLLEVPAPEVAK
jgi:multidrug efflux pump subunit AcrA (membrane-fusion protein)